MQSYARDYLCLALDRLDRDAIMRLTDDLRDQIGCFKINSAFVEYGPDLIRDIKSRQVAVFLDLKFHDIPATVAAHVKAAAGMGVDWLTVHAGGGRAMMRAAVAAARESAVNASRPRLLAVTVLTSLDQQALNDDLRVAGAMSEHIIHLARSAAECGMDGMVCSGADLELAREHLPSGFLAVTPGISGIDEPAGADQKRTSNPVAAIRAGASMLVIGRAIIDAPDPSESASKIRHAVESALQDSQ